MTAYSNLYELLNYGPISSRGVPFVSPDEVEQAVGELVGGLEGVVGEVVTSKTVHCTSCGHQGSVASHRKVGCSTCGTGSACSSDSGEDCPCPYHQKDNQTKLAELNVLNKAVASPGWPFVNVVEEFYRSDQLISNHSSQLLFLPGSTAIFQPASAGPDPSRPTSWTSA